MPLTERDRKTIKIGAIVAGAMLVLVLGLNFLGGGDTDTIALDIPVPTPTASSTSPGTTGGPTATPSSPGHTPTTIFTGRDPFSLPAVFQSTATTSGSTSPGTSGSTSPGTSGSTSPGTSGSTSPGTSTTPTKPGNGSGTRVGGHDVVLLDTFTVNGVDTVQVEVDGTVYNVSEGDTFGPGNSFELLSVSDNCAAFLFGVESFTLCIAPQK